jgi:membrane-associated phospholipid phosphatase
MFSNTTQSKLSSNRVTWKHALLVSVGTSLLFMLFYGGVSYLTSLRSDVGIWYYEWEQIIPFVPAMIVPYMSIDVFFFLAPFFCRDRDELRVLAWRLSAVVVVAAICFLVYPLQLAVERPKDVPGVFGVVYNWFTALDRPYNLNPSMHIALRTILAAHYAKHCRRWLRAGMHFWFFLIGCSTLMLYQHHVIDVVGGFVLAVLVMYVIDGLTWRLPKMGGQKFAALYAITSCGFVIAVLLEPKWGWLTMWPAVACGLVALGYAWLGPAVYRRHEGKLTWPARIVLGPVLAGQWLSWKYYAKQSAKMDHIVDGVWIGRHLGDASATALVESGEIGAVVDVCNAFCEPDALRKIERLELPILDLTAPTPEQLDHAIEFIEKHHERGVLVHCKAGYSRSAAIVAAWLVRSGRASSSTEAFEKLSEARPQIVIRPEIRSMEF